MSAAANSVRADLEAAIKEHEPEPADEVVEPVVVASKERTRDESGRFAKGEAGEVGKVAEGAEVVPEKSAGMPDKGAEPQESVATSERTEAKHQPLAPPNGWTAEAKAKWHELPPEVMAAVQKREQDVAKFTSTRDEHASFGKEIYQTVQPYLATIKAEGGTPATAIQSLLNTAYVLRTGSPERKRELLIETARQFGVDLGAPQSATTATPQTPEIQRLQGEIAELKNILTQGQQAELNRVQTEVQTEIEAFASSPDHPHYHEVKVHMAALLREGVAKDLKDAYDQSVWARPDLRATLLAQQRAEEEQKRRDEAKAKAEAAKRKSISITGGPGNTAAAAAPGGRSIREELEANMAASSGAV